MKAFTYDDYLYYKKLQEQKIRKQLFQLLNNEVEYHRKEKPKAKKVTTPHDKIFKEVLDNKEEVAIFLNKILKLENADNTLTAEDIEKYPTEFITATFSKMESDVIYKKKNQNIFFLIEHQSKIDYSMPYRLLKYNMAIIESAIDNEKIKNKSYKLPLVYSFVIYTGNSKWNTCTDISKMQEDLPRRQ